MFGSFYGRKKQTSYSPLDPCLAELDIPNTKTYFNADEGVFVLYKNVENPQKCDAVGIDIGEKYFSIVGFVKRNLRGEELSKHSRYSCLTWRYECSQICLLSLPFGLDQNCDYLGNLLRNHEQLEWVRNSTRAGIEGQMLNNVKNMVVARSVKDVLLSIYYTKNAGEVYIVQARCKYTVYPIMDVDYVQPGKSEKDTNLKRKKLGYDHAKRVMRTEGDDTTWNAIRILESFLEKVFDITDAYIVGRYMDLRELNKKKKTTKRKQVSNRDLSTNDEFITAKRAVKKRKNDVVIIDLC